MSISAGTSDAPVAAEAALTVAVHGSTPVRIADVGVAGLHRLLGVRDRLDEADCLIVVAGMEGALPSVVGGLTGVPMVAVPTSVGYGASLGGIAALLAMLNSCAPGVTVVNIDNGYGAGVHAARVARQSATMTDAVWVDASAGASGDMLLGALVGAGVPLAVLQDAVDAVAPEPVTLRVEEVRRGGLAATRCHVDAAESHHHRTWRDVRALLDGHDLALAVFERLAVAEAAVHGTTPDEVHFHEVGALDAIADIVGVCAGFTHLGADVGDGLPRRRRVGHRPGSARHPAGAAARGGRAAARASRRSPGRSRWRRARRRAPRCSPRSRPRGVRSRR